MCYKHPKIYPSISLQFRNFCFECEASRSWGSMLGPWGPMGSSNPIDLSPDVHPRQYEVGSAISHMIHLGKL